MRRALLTLIYLGLLPLLVVGCRSAEVASGLDLRQSMEVLVVLHGAEIKAVREKVGSGRREHYTISVPEADYLRAIEILHRHGLPKETDKSIESLINPGTFMPTSPAMARMRQELAYALQIERMISGLPGVSDVRVAVSTSVSNEPDRAMGEGTSATILLKYADSSQPGFSIEEVKEIARQIIPSLEAGEITVKTHALIHGQQGSAKAHTLESLVPFAFDVPAPQLALAKRQLVIALFSAMLFGVVATLGILKIYSMLATKRSPLAKQRSLLSEDSDFFTEGSRTQRPSRQPTLMIDPKDDKSKGRR